MVGPLTLPVVRYVGEWGGWRWVEVVSLVVGWYGDGGRGWWRGVLVVELYGRLRDGGVGFWSALWVSSGIVLFVLLAVCWLCGLLGAWPGWRESVVASLVASEVFVPSSQVLVDLVLGVLVPTLLFLLVG